MANTTFTDGVTVVVSEWLNDVNDVVYDVLGDGVNAPTTKAGLRTALNVPQRNGTDATGTWSINVTGNAATATTATSATTATTATTALGPLASTTAPGLSEFATTAETETGAATNLAVTPAAYAAAKMIYLASQAASGQTTVNRFSSIPSWAKKIHVFFDGWSSSGTNLIVIRIGGGGAVEATGYVGATSSIAGAGSSTGVWSTGITIRNINTAAAAYNGIVTLTKVSTGNIWAIHGGVSDGTSLNTTISGIKSTSSALDSIQVTSVGSTDTFDAGTVYFAYE